MAAKIFNTPGYSSVPKSDPRIVRVDMSKSDLGARKSHLSKASKGKNDYGIQHVGKK